MSTESCHFIATNEAGEDVTLTRVQKLNEFKSLDGNRSSHRGSIEFFVAGESVNYEGNGKFKNVFSDEIYIVSDPETIKKIEG